MVDYSDERSLVLACQEGDSGAFAGLVRRYQDLALRAAYLLTNDPQAAEDVSQNTFLAVFRNLHRFDPERPFKPWFLGILANEARMHRRWARRHPSETLDTVTPATGQSLVDQVVRDDERAQVRQALARLDEPQRTTAVLYYLADLSVDQVGAALGCRTGTVKSRLHAARNRLRALLSMEAPTANARREPTQYRGMVTDDLS